MGMAVGLCSETSGRREPFHMDISTSMMPTKKATADPSGIGGYLPAHDVANTQAAILTEINHKFSKELHMQGWKTEDMRCFENCNAPNVEKNRNSYPSARTTTRTRPQTRRSEERRNARN